MNSHKPFICNADICQIHGFKIARFNIISTAENMVSPYPVDLLKISTTRKLCLANEIHNLKWLKITQICLT